MKSLSVSFQTTTDMKHGQPLFTLLMFIGLLTITGSTLGDSQEENTRGMKLARGDLSVATNEIERFYALGDAARNALKEGKVKEAKALATELARMTPKYRVEKAKKHLLASANSKGSPQLNSFGPNFKLAGKLAEKGEYKTVLRFLAQVKMFWANPNDRREANSKHVAGMHLQQLDSWRKQLQAGKVPDHPRWR